MPPELDALFARELSRLEAAINAAHEHRSMGDLSMLRTLRSITKDQWHRWQRDLTSDNALSQRAA